MYIVFLSMSVSWSSSPESDSHLALTAVSLRRVKILAYDVMRGSCCGDDDVACWSCGGCCCC